MERSKSRTKKLVKIGQQAVVFGAAVTVSLLLSMILVGYLDLDPISALSDIISGSFGNKNAIGETIVKMTPILLTGLSFTVAYQCGLTNLGMEGQLYMGALASTAVGSFLPGLPFAIHLPLAIFAGFLGGAFWGLIAGFLKVKSGASEIITTVMMNEIAINFVGFMVAGPMGEPTGLRTQTPAIMDTSRLPKILAGTRAHFGFLIALLCVVLIWQFFKRTKKGFEIRIAGHNSRAARYAGINLQKNILLVMAIAGGLAGLSGASEILGIQHMMLPIISPGYGFNGVAVSMIGMNTPIGNVFGALLFGALRAGGNRMQMKTRVPLQIVEIMQGLVIVTVVASNIVLDKWNEHKLKRLSVEDAKMKEGVA